MMKKKVFSVCMIAMLAMSVCSVKAADFTPPSATRNSLKSEGAIVYQDGDESVVIDSQDLYILADKLDTFKTAVGDQLAVMHTYLTTEDKGVSLSTNDEVHVVHAYEESMQLAIRDCLTLTHYLKDLQPASLSPLKQKHTGSVRGYSYIKNMTEA